VQDCQSDSPILEPEIYYSLEGIQSEEFYGVRHTFYIELSTSSIRTLRKAKTSNELRYQVRYFKYEGQRVAMR
jgi:hypothetical protein